MQSRCAAAAQAASSEVLEDWVFTDLPLLVGLWRHPG